MTSGPRRRRAPSWTSAAWLNHLVRGNLLFVAVLGDEPRPEPGTDHLGDDPLAAFRGAAGRLREAFGAPGVLERGLRGSVRERAGRGVPAADRLAGFLGRQV